MNRLLHFKMEFLALLSKAISLQEKYTSNRGKIEAIESLHSLVEKWDLSLETIKGEELRKRWENLSNHETDLNRSTKAQMEFNFIEAQIELLLQDLQSPETKSSDSNSSPVCYLGSPEIRKEY